MFDMENMQSNHKLLYDNSSNESYLKNERSTSEKNTYDSSNTIFNENLEKNPTEMIQNPLFAISQHIDQSSGWNVHNSRDYNQECFSAWNHRLPSDQQNSTTNTPKTDNRKTKRTDFWRPFTPEPMETTILTSKNYKNHSVDLDDQNKFTKSLCFPRITPSYVKLGSAKSVFKAVKKKKYQCQYCYMSYSYHEQLTGHVRAHAGSKPYHCEFPSCSRAFARNEELTRHKRIHSGYKPHQCEVCQKQFGRKDHLNKHAKTHLKTSEKKVYLCQVPGCGHKYTRSDALTRHQTMAHANKTCKHCQIINS